VGMPVLCYWHESQTVDPQGVKVIQALRHREKGAVLLVTGSGCPVTIPPQKPSLVSDEGRFAIAGHCTRSLRPPFGSRPLCASPPPPWQHALIFNLPACARMAAYGANEPM
jgi:hypothetical protein